MKRYLSILITFLVSMPLFPQTSEMQIVGDPRESRTEFVGSNIRDANNNICAAIQILSDMDGFSYDANNEVVRVDDMPGKDMVYLQPGERVLEIFKSGFKPLKIILAEYGIQLASKQVWILEITGEQKEKMVPVSIVVDPADATVMIDGERRLEGKTIRLTPGEHTLVIQKDMYEPQKATIQASEDNVLFEYTLQKSQPAFLVITSDPSAADVYLNGELKGTTPFQEQLASGEYQLELRKALYERASKTVVIKGGETQEENILLTPNFGDMHITSTPSEVSIEIDGKPVGITPFETGRLTAGEHTIVLRKGLYHPLEQRVTIQKGETLPLNAVLKPAFGSLRITTNPPGITLYLDGREIGKTPIIEEQLASGVYEMTLAGEMMREVMEQITIRDGETTERQVTMPIDFGTLNIRTDSDVFVLIDGRSAGIGSMTQRVKAGSHQIEGRKTKYNTDAQNVSIAVGETKSITLRPLGRFGSLSVIVNPPQARDAMILVDDKNVGNAPRILKDLLEGTHQVALRKNGYLPFSTSVDIQLNKETKLNPTLLTYRGSMQQEKNRWKLRSWLTTVTTAACAGVTVYANIMGNDAFSKYESAQTMADATQHRDDTNKYDNFTKIGAGVTGAFAVWTIYNWIKTSSIKVESAPGISVQFDSQRNEMGIRLAVEF